MSKNVLGVALLALFVAAGCARESKPDAKPAAGKKEPAPLETAPATASEKTAKAVTAAIDAWAAAWEARDVSKYLAAYAADFKPEKGTRKDWEKQRAERLRGSKNIKVTVGNPKVTASGPNNATATFLQVYESDKFSDQTKKTLELRNVDGKWLIVRERSS